MSCPEVWRPIFWKAKRIYILSRSMGADILKKVLFINLFYFVVPIGITACSIIMDVALVIEAAEQYFVYRISSNKRPPKISDFKINAPPRINAPFE